VVRDFATLGLIPVQTVPARTVHTAQMVAALLLEPVRELVQNNSDTLKTFK